MKFAVFSLLATLVAAPVQAEVPAAAKLPYPAIEVVTSEGTFIVELDEQQAPTSVSNFCAYAKSGHYDGTIFHRVIPGFMIQGGGFDDTMQQKSTRSPIKNEANNGLHNEKGTIAMARTSDPHSATAQFFINLKDNDFLDNASDTPQGWGYAVFGKIVGGMDVVEKIAQVKTGVKGMHRDVPLETVKIERVEIV